MITMLKVFLRALHAVFFAAMLLVSPAGMTADFSTDDHIVSRAFFRDETGQRRLEEVFGASFAPISGMFAGGYTNDIIWMRVKVRPSATGQPLVLRILPAYLNNVTLYEPDPAHTGGWRSIETGNSVPWKDRPNGSVSLGFTVQPTSEATYFLRLKTLTNTQLYVEALEAPAATQRDIRTLLWQGFYIAIFFWIVFWALSDYLLSRDHVILTFILVHLVYLAYVLSTMGYLAILLPDETHIPTISFWLVTVAIFASIIFHRELLLLFDVPKSARWALNALLLSSGAAVGLLLLGQAAVALKLNSFLVLLAGPLLFIVAMSLRGNASPGLWPIRLFYGVLFISLVVYVSPILGLAEASSWSLFGALFHGLLSALMAAGLLHWRSRALVAQESEARLQLARSEHQLDFHRKQLEEQSRFTAMLTHELKNPLSSIRFNVDAMIGEGQMPEGPRKKRIDHAIAEIDGLAERCILADRIEQRTMSPSLTEVDVATLVAELVGHYANAERIRQQAPDRLAPALCDVQLLRVAIGNLTDNALRYSPNESSVDIHLAESTDASGMHGVRVDVVNTPGVAGLPDPEHAFDKYYRGANVTHLGGTGLGLYLVKGIASKLGGTVSYKLVDGRITFTLWIPLTPP